MAKIFTSYLTSSLYGWNITKDGVKDKIIALIIHVLMEFS
jgi:hypothetical protein